MKWEWITLLYTLQNVISLELGTSSVPAMSIKKINRGRHKPSRIPNYPMESAINSESLPESFFPDVVYPTTILDAAQPFYYSQHGYDEVLGPFSNDIKSSYKTLAAGKESNPSKDITVSLLTDHKNTIPHNKSSINNDSSDTSVNESYDHASYLEDDAGKSEQNNKYITVNETVLENSTLHHKDQQLINQDKYKDISEEFSTTNGEDTMEILNSKSKEVQDVEENLQWNDNIPMEKQIPFGGLKENLLERETLHGSIHVKNYQQYISPNSFVTSEISTNKDDTELRYTSDTNMLNFTSTDNNEPYNANNQEDTELLYSNRMKHLGSVPNYIMNLKTCYNQDITQSSNTADADNIIYVNLTTDTVVTSDTKVNENTTETLDVTNDNELCNLNNQENMKTDKANNDDTVCTDLTDDVVITSDPNKNLIAIEMLNVTNNTELHNANIQNETNLLYTSVNYTMKPIVLTVNNIVTSDTCNSQLKRQKSDTVNKHNIIYVNLTSDEDNTSNTNENQKSIEKADIANNKEPDTANNQRDTELLYTNSKQSNAIEEVSSTPNNIVPPDANYNQEDTELSATTNFNQTYVNITPNYVLTSNTGNTQEEFISDIMNIYSLIEETLRSNN